MVSKLMCWIVGHKRGKRTGVYASEHAPQYQCPRCGATWTRKVYPRKPKP